MWNGISATGNPLSMTDKQMSEWALANEQQFQIGWSNQKQFGEREVSDPVLRGARFVRIAPGESSYSEAATRAGWPDLAEKFSKAGM